MSPNKIEYSSAIGPYFTMNYVKAPFLMPKFSISTIISHHFLVDKNKGGLGIGYDMIIGLYLMVQL